VLWLRSRRVEKPPTIAARFSRNFPVAGSLALLGAQPCKCILGASAERRNLSVSAVLALATRGAAVRPIPLVGLSVAETNTIQAAPRRPAFTWWPDFVLVVRPRV